jgi:hypothetical protein
MMRKAWQWLGDVLERWTDGPYVTALMADRMPPPPPSLAPILKRMAWALVILGCAALAIFLS